MSGKKDEELRGLVPNPLLPGENQEDSEPDSDEESSHYHDEVALPTPKTVARVARVFNEDGTIRQIIKAPKSSFVSTLIYLDGKPFDFTGREYLFPIYNRNSPRILLKTSRQVEKTTFLANNLTVDSLVINYNKSLYVSPSHTQTRQFSNEKLRPAIEKSPFVKKYFQDHSVSTQVFEKGFTNGSYIFLRSAFRSADRCLPASSKILLADGTEKSIKDVQVGDLVISYDGTKPSVMPVDGKEFNGPKETLRLELVSGHALECSTNHRFLTQRGLVRADELTNDDWVPLPFDYASGRADDSRFALWVGFLLGDGCLAKIKRTDKHTCYFSNSNTEAIAAFESLCRELGLQFSRKEDRRTPTTNYIVHVFNPIIREELLGPLGILGTGQHTTFIPEVFFSSRSEICAVLKGLFESDGCVTFGAKRSSSEVSFTTGSELLANSVQRGLMSVGVFSKVIKVTPKSDKRSIFYRVRIAHAKHILRFSNNVGFVSYKKNRKLSECLEFIAGCDPVRSRGLDVPAREICKKIIREHNLSRDTFSISDSVRPGSNVVSHFKVMELYEKTGSKDLLPFLQDNVVWQRIRSIASAGVQDTWDIGVSTDHMFVANGMFTHNTRGISARNLALDELQDFLGSEIPVITECTSHFPDARILMAGTPKSHDNPIQTYWEETTQNEWLVPCSCRKWNFLDDSNIGPTECYRNGKLPPGPICKKCGKPINVRSGQWMCTAKGKLIEGYRIPQLMVPWIIGLPDQWERLLWKRDNYPMGQLYNEVLGLSYDSASKPITRDELIEICDSYDLWDGSNLTPAMIAESKKFILTAGVDWGEGNDGSEKSPSGKIRNASYTVLTIGAYINQKQFAVKLVKKYEGREVDPDFVVKDIARICGALGVRLIGVDWGHGWGVNNHLSRLYGGTKVVQFQYLPKLKHRLKWDPIGYRYHVQRNFMMSELFFDMKNGLVRFPRWAQIERFAKDILGIYAEYVEFRREMKYDHKPTDPDDFFHSLHYSKLASDIHLGKSRKYTVDVVQSGS